MSELATRFKMAKILADKDIRKLLGSVVLGTDDVPINPNGLEVRLGRQVLFQSTGEQKEMSEGMFLRVLPGESVLISSYESFDFSVDTIQKIFPACSLMAFITPTTTMMREGILQSSTKVDAGFRGTLNWGIRNSSIREFILGFREPIFKLTICLLEGDEVPEVDYGGRDTDRYQGTEGIAASTRRVPVSIPKGKIIGSSIEKLDPAKQLREAGYPFDHISTELTDLHGKFEVVSKDVLLLKDTIASEAKKLSDKVDDSRKTSLEKVEDLFDRKFMGAIGRILACGSVMYGTAVFLQGQGLSERALGGTAIAAGVGIFAVMHFLTIRKKP
jgi:deoxycytidine triphosphate deaminase